MVLVRLLFQTAFLAFGQIWANKTRAALTTLGIIIGVSAVIATVSATDGLRKFVLSEFATIGANKVWIFPNRPDRARDRFSWRQIRITREQVDGMLDAAPSLMRLTPVMELSGPVEYGPERRPFVPVRGIRPAWHDIEQRFVTQGRTFSRIDEEERRPVCLINDKAVQEFRMDANPVGRYILVEGRRLLIVGVVETKTVSPIFGAGDAQSEIYVPFSYAELMRPQFGRIYVIAQTKAPELFEDAKAEVTFYMRRMRGLSGDDPNTFGVEAIEQFIQQFNKLAGGITVIAAGFVAISLLVGGIGIMNIMLVSVSERTREIGLRKAVGARPGVILMQFLVEAVVLCLVGAGIGLAIGAGFTFLLKVMPGSPLKEAEVRAWSVILAAGFSAATGLIFGMFPALKAARLDPIVALRHE
jgi:putative ABC transport system permease protein